MTIKILPEVKAQIDALVQACPVEINGLGHVSEQEDGQLLIDAIEVLKQEVSATSADHDKDDLLRFFAGVSDPQNWCVQWHSHATMSVYFSHTDEDCIKAIGETADFLISLVFNKKGEYKARVDMFLPEPTLPNLASKFFTSTRGQTTAEDITLEVENDLPDFSEWAREQMAEKVKQITAYTAPHTYQMTPKDQEKNKGNEKGNDKEYESDYSYNYEDDYIDDLASAYYKNKGNLLLPDDEKTDKETAEFLKKESSARKAISKLKPDQVKAKKYQGKAKKWEAEAGLNTGTLEWLGITDFYVYKTELLVKSVYGQKDFEMKMINTILDMVEDTGFFDKGTPPIVVSPDL